MADNTCHFGINSMFADGGVKPGHGEDTTRLYFPADQHQFAACVKRIYHDPGLRFLFSTRSPVPDILDEAGKPFYQGKAFEPGKDDVDSRRQGRRIRRRLRRMRLPRPRRRHPSQEQGAKVGLINKATLNVYDEAMMKKLVASPFVLVVEGWNVKTGLGSRFGTELLKRGFKGKYNHIGTHLEGSADCGSRWATRAWIPTASRPRSSA